MKRQYKEIPANHVNNDETNSTAVITVLAIELTPEQRAKLTVEEGVEIIGMPPEKYADDLENNPKTW